MSRELKLVAGFCDSPGCAESVRIRACRGHQIAAMPVARKLAVLC